MTIADLVAAPDRQQAPLKTLAHVEFQLRVLGLLCAAAAGGPTKLATPGSLDLWFRYITLQRSSLGCDTCQSAALDVADSINAEVATGTSIRQMRNQVFHGGPDPENVDLDALHRVVAANADQIVAIHAHGHVTRLDPFFIPISGELAALNDYSEGSATYWPRRGPATDITRREILDALQKLNPQGGDRLLENFALDIQKDLRGFAERDSIQTLVVPPQPIVARWDLRTSSGTIRRVDRFELNVDHARTWQSESGPKPYKAFLADICNWELLKERLLEELEEQIEVEGQISDELFPVLKRHVPDVPARVRVADGPFGDGSDVTITQACERITARAGIYSSYTNLITLTGEAGSGKTHSLLEFARESLSGGGEFNPLAIYISSSGTSANSLDTLLDARMARTRILDRSSVLALCRAGLAILVIDGFDELLGFRTYDNPLTGLKPILDALRGKGTLILSARSSYSEARLRQNLEHHATLDWPPYVTTLELLPWRREQLRMLTGQLPVDVPMEETSPEVRQLLTTPFFCLAFAAWARSDKPLEFLQFVVETYLQRERRKLAGQGGIELFGSGALADIFSEVAELIARSAVPEISEEDLELAASQALSRDLSKEEKRRLIALCGMSAEWAEDELSFKFTHLAIAEQFLARQVARLPLDQAVSLLFSVPISALCAQLIVSIWRTQHGGAPTELITALQDRVTTAEPYDQSLPGAISLGELWAKVHGTADGHREARRIRIEDLELVGSGRVSLEEAHIQNLAVGPGIELLLTASYIYRLDLSKSSGAALVGDSYKQVLELLTQSELAVGQPRIKHALGLTEDAADDVSEIDSYFRSSLLLARGPIIVSSREFTPEEDSRLNWVLEYGLDAWQGFVRRMQTEGKITLEKVNASGRPKVRLRATEKFHKQ
ncbi:NACHT domain-containing protein [Micromonospora wenchangensis]|uniref:NACHT domain-containing protein n=1 Tax=Micromonospora wenchangensis TaxID=1185415 RepID=UPI003809D2C0